MNSAATASRYSHRRRFTLIELLVVTAIILLLVGMLMGAVQNSKTKAQRVVCKTNLNQLGLAAVQYYTDFDEFFPNHNDDNSGSNWARSIFVMREYYSRAFEIVTCPIDIKAVKPPSDINDPFPYSAQQYYWSYVYNCRMADGFPDVSSPMTVRMQSFVDPQRTIVLFEGNENDGGAENDGGDGPVDNPSMPPYVRHAEGCHYLFADGHTEWRAAGTLQLSEFTPGAD